MFAVALAASISPAPGCSSGHTADKCRCSSHCSTTDRHCHTPAASNRHSVAPQTATAAVEYPSYSKYLGRSWSITAVDCLPGWSATSSPQLGLGNRFATTTASAPCLRSTPSAPLLGPCPISLLDRVCGVALPSRCSHQNRST